MQSVMVVDDEASILGLVAAVLRHAGYAVVEARCGQDALSLVDSGCRPDVLVTDVQMPLMGGREVADELRMRIPGLPVIFVSGFVDDPVLESRVMAGQETLLMKPGAISQVPAEVARKLSLRAAACPQASPPQGQGRAAR